MKHWIKSKELAIACIESRASLPPNVVVEFDVITFTTTTDAELQNTLAHLNLLLQDWQEEAANFKPIGAEIAIKTKFRIEL